MHKRSVTRYKTCCWSTPLRVLLYDCHCEPWGFFSFNFLGIMSLCLFSFTFPENILFLLLCMEALIIIVRAAGIGLTFLDQWANFTLVR